jgi:AsmA-like C-terminal region/AsmA family
MRKAITIVVVFAGVIVLGVFGVLLYAYLNLNSIIADNQGRVLLALSNKLGRDVQAGEIKASLGWGVSADISDLKVADDPAMSQQPFIEADTVAVKLNLVPLLSKRLDVTEVILEKPVIHIVQAADGKLNVTTIGRRREHREEMVPRLEARAPAGGSPLEAAGGGERRPLPSLFVKNFTVEDGQLVFDQLANGTKVTVNSIELHVRDFSFDKEFEIDLSLAALGDKQNLDIGAKVGPLVQSGALDINGIPLSAKVTAGPLDFDSLKTIAMLAKAIPPKLEITQPITATATADGTVGAIKFNAASDLTANQITFGDSFIKPASVALKVSADGAREGSDIEVRLAEVALGDIDMKVTDIKLGHGAPSARIDTNSFDIAPLGKMVPALAKYDASGKTELHLNAALANGKPVASGTVALTGVGLALPDQKNAPPLSGLSGTINLAGKSADVGPLTFNLGASRATLSSHVESIQPVRLSYQLSADAIHLADLVPSRPQDEQINQLASNGTVALSDSGPIVKAHVTSGSGSIAKVGYQNLALDGSLAGKAARISSLKLAAFSGTLAATADTQLAARAPFNAAINFSSLNVQQALQSEQSKAAGTVRGLVTGNINVVGTFDQMKPTFRGNGRVSVANGQLIGINVGADALKKVRKLPGIGDLISPAMIAKHPELFANPNTDIQSASLTFTLQGPRITSHDINVQTVDYGMLGDGWFDMDKNVDLAANIILTRAFTQDLVNERGEIVYVTNKNGEVNIPLQIVGQLPKPRVLPDVNQLVQQAGSRAVEAQGQKAINKFLGKKGLGGLLGGGNNNNGGNNDNNPLNQLKSLF